MMDESFALTPPQPVAAVAETTAQNRVQLAPQEQLRLDAQVHEFVEIFVTADAASESFMRQVTALATLGQAELERSATQSNRMLERPSAAKGNLEKKGGVAGSLSELRNVIEGLDPTLQSAMFAPRRLLGIIPFGSKVRDYFDRYQSAQSQIDAIMTVLYRGKDELLLDNAAIETEKAAMWTTMQTLRAAVYLCENIDKAIELKVAALMPADASRAQALRDEVLLTARSRRVDLLTQLAVNVQGYQVLDLLKKNNLELLKGVDRATTTTISALRTAVTASQALAGQRIVLNQITALNETTGQMIEATSKLLGTQGTTIAAAAGNATIDIDRLKAAFTNIYAALDAVDTYKAQAVQSLGRTALVLQEEIGRADLRLRPTAPQ